MKIVKMKDAVGNLHSRIPHKDIPYHLKNGWELVEDKAKKKSVKPQVEADTLTPNEGEE
jgi:hypothetical protein